MEFVDRKKELTRLQKALQREKSQFIAVYGRRRIGKSTLIKKVMDFSRGDIYFLADKTSEPSQRQLFSTTVDMSIEGFSMANYPTWESLFVSLVNSFFLSTNSILRYIYDAKIGFLGYLAKSFR